MAKRVLSVGNCNSDHSKLRRVLREKFGAQVDRAAGQREAIQSLRGGQFDLILVNRRLMGDGSDGVALIRHIKSDPQLASLPVMLLSDHPLHQEMAVACGAEPGFGKSELADAAIRQRLAPFLSE